MGVQNYLGKLKRVALRVENSQQDRKMHVFISPPVFETTRMRDTREANSDREVLFNSIYKRNEVFGLMTKKISITFRVGARF